MGLADDLDRRARRGDDADPNREQRTPSENPAVVDKYP